MDVVMSLSKERCGEYYVLIIYLLKVNVSKDKLRSLKYNS